MFATRLMISNENPLRRHRCLLVQTYDTKADQSKAVIPNSHYSPQYDKGAQANKHSSTVPFDLVTPITSVPSPDERLEVNPPESLFIIRDEVVKTDLGHTVQLTNIESICFCKVYPKF
ncbi:hypothetical protein DAPPUDRAFT_268497 [Daphnia pulex]|uniref:Uncharacterized protein n=1 Tax=Daphnia pulex TaxID=6669 RepID=E9HXW5_DAPPU|nr:hypothetical protein DAPPUDRAFT_268497 [Daphnia pulex]|eukprot:EFX63415.1 hypothetical protein DAPPUDRAFT_268497 [Daphnia pulex]